MNELQLHLYHVITSLIETDGLDGYFLDQDAWGKRELLNTQQFVMEYLIMLQNTVLQMTLTLLLQDVMNTFNL